MLSPPIPKRVVVADATEAARDDLVATAARETGLTEARLTGEVGRCAMQFRLFAEAVTTLEEQGATPIDWSVR